MQARWMGLVLGLLWLGVGLSLIGLVVWTGTTDYADFSRQLLAWAGKSDWQRYFETRVLPPARYAWLPELLSFAALGWVGAGFFLWVRRRWLLEQWAALGAALRGAVVVRWKVFSARERGVVALLLLAFVLRWGDACGRYALQYDEAWTYNHFTANGLLVSLLSPNNNHILYTLFACLGDVLPLEGVYRLRLPVVLGGVALLGSAALWWRARWSWGWTLVALTSLAFCPGVGIYSLLARGYIFQMGCSFWALAATIYLASSAGGAARRAAWVVWSGSLIVGLWSVPTHAYVCVVLSAVLLVYSLKQGEARAWLRANVAVWVVVALLYAPYWVTNGGATLWAAGGSDAPSGDAFWAYQDKVADWLLLGAGRGTPVYGVLLGLVAALLVGMARCWRRGQPIVEPLLLVLLLLLPTGLNVLTGIQPPYRVWCFLSVPLAWSVGWLGMQSGRRWKPALLAVCLPLLVAFQLWRLERHYALQWCAELDQNVKVLAATLLAHNIRTVYLFTNYDKPLLEYYYRDAQRPLTLYMAAPNSQHYAPFDQFPLYSAALWNPASERPTAAERQWLHRHYTTLLYSDERVRAHVSATSLRKR